MDWLGAIAEEHDDKKRAQLAYEFLREFHRGRPVVDLLPLIESADTVLNEVGVWIASELGENARPLLRCAEGMLSSTSPYVRYHALIVVLNSATPADAEVVFGALRLMEDRVQPVRAEATMLLVRIGREVLTAVHQTLRRNRSTSTPGEAERTHLQGFELMLGERSTDELREMLRDQHPVLRRYGIVTAMRDLVNAIELLELARGSQDLEILVLAQDLIKRRSWDNPA